MRNPVGRSQIEVVGTASDGHIALAKIAQLHPDLVTLDVEMPVLNGLETLAELRKVDRKFASRDVSSTSQNGGRERPGTPCRGRIRLCTKPSNTGSPAAAVAAIRGPN